MSGVLDGICRKGGDALVAKIVKAGVANLTLNEKGLLKLLPAKGAALRGLVG